MSCDHFVGSSIKFDEALDISNRTNHTANVQNGSVGLDLFGTVLIEIDGQTRDTQMGGWILNFYPLVNIPEAIENGHL